MKRTSNLSSWSTALLLSITTFSAHAGPPSSLINVETLADRIATYEFGAAAGISIGNVEMISEDEFVEKRVEIQIGGEVLKLSSYFGSKTWNPDQSSCAKIGSTTTCTSNEIRMDERGFCSQTILEISGLEVEKEILLDLKSNHWSAKGQGNCSIAKDRGAPTVAKKIAKFRGLSR
jgi:hypothetical protein